MKAEESKRLVIVSIFITIALVIMALGIFTLGGQQKRFGESVTIKAIFDNVSGLKQGNNVWFSGVKIGTVKSIELYNQSQVMVTMNIEEESHKYIRKDALARLGSESMIGNKMIEIVGGTMQMPVVSENDILRIETTLSTDEILETFQENNKNLQAITTDFKAISAQMVKGEGPVGKLISDSVMAAQFLAITANLERIST
ncbi:MAG: MCE family protein, partial [Moraxellaceae bacterium]